MKNWIELVIFAIILVVEICVLAVLGYPEREILKVTLYSAGLLSGLYLCGWLILSTLSDLKHGQWRH